MNARVDNSPHQLSCDASEHEGSEAAANGGSDKSNNGVRDANFLMYGDPSLERIESSASPKKALGVHTRNSIQRSRSIQSFFNFRVTLDAASESVSCHVPEHGPSVRRALETRPLLGCNFTGHHTSCFCSSGAHGSTRQRQSLAGATIYSNKTRLDAGSLDPVAPIMNASSLTPTAHGGECTSSNIETDDITGATRDAASSPRVTQCLPLRAAVPISERNNADTASSSLSSPLATATEVANTTKLVKDARYVSSLRDVLYDTTPTSSYRGDTCGSMAPSPRRKCGVFGLFATIELGLFKAFSGIFENHQQLLEPFLCQVMQSSHDVFPTIFNLMEFLRNPCNAPNESFFTDPLIAWPMHVLYTSSCFYVTAKLHGYCDTFEAIRSRGGLLANGKGFFSALAVAISPTEEELVQHTSEMLRASFFVGLIYSKNEERLQMHLKYTSCRSIALLLINISMTSLQLLLEEVNRVRVGGIEKENKWGSPNVSSMIPMWRVEITRVIGPRSAVVCGHPLDLGRLETLLIRYASVTGVRIHKEYLPFASPDSNFLDNRLQHLELLQLWADNDIKMDKTTLHLNLYSPVDGKLLGDRCTDPLIVQVALVVTSLCHDLTCSTRHLRDGDVLLEFSAGFHRVGHLIAWTRRNIIVLSEPMDCVDEKVLPSPSRSVAKNIIQATFSKCSTINTILQSVHRGSTLHSMCIKSLSTSFVDLGLLIRDDQFIAKNRAALFSDLYPRKHISINDQNCLFFSNLRKRMQSGGTATVVEADTGVSRMSEVGNSESSGAASVDSIAAAASLLPLFYPPDYVVVPNEATPNAINVYQVSPRVRYYESQLKCILTRAGVEFASKLSQYTGFAFPPHTLLMCPTVLHLLELWDTYDFLIKGGIDGSGGEK